MKVYVDKIPKKCEDCVFSETGFVWDSEVRFCKLKPRCMNWIALYDKKRKDCTLCSLADHDKQVIKKVLDDLGLALLLLFPKDEELSVGEICDWLQEVKDQIQGDCDEK